MAAAARRRLENAVRPEDMVLIQSVTRMPSPAKPDACSLRDLALRVHAQASAGADPLGQADDAVLVLDTFGDVVLQPNELAEFAGEAQAGQAGGEMHGLSRQQPRAHMGA